MEIVFRNRWTGARFVVVGRQAAERLGPSWEEVTS